jgi:hypothetical protein
MTVDDRRALVSRLSDREAAAGLAIGQDADFMALAELWIDGEVDVPELRRRYQLIREDRLKKKRLPLATSQSHPSPNEYSEESSNFFDRPDG